jgi:hypothetical protein
VRTEKNGGRKGRQPSDRPRPEFGPLTLWTCPAGRNLHSFVARSLDFASRPLPSSSPQSQVHGESSAASQSSLLSQTGTSFEASEEAPQEAASCVRLFYRDVRSTDSDFDFLTLIKPFAAQKYYRKHGTSIKLSDKSRYTQSVTWNV